MCKHCNDKDRETNKTTTFHKQINKQKRKPENDAQQQDKVPVPATLGNFCRFTNCGTDRDLTNKVHQKEFEI